MTSVDTFVTQSGVTSNYNAAGNAAIGSNLGTITPPAGMNAAIGFESAVFNGGYDAVVLDGSRANYAIAVDASGNTTIKDNGVGDPTYGQTVTVSGESYIVFNPAATVTTVPVPQPNVTTSVLDYPNNIYYVLDPAHAQMAQFYAATLPWEPMPNTGGLNYWMGRLDAGMPLTSIAQSFINTTYFQQTFGDPGTTHAQHLTFIESLYQNILAMNVDAGNSGVQYWTNAMDTNPAMDGAHALISFTNATSTTATINAMAGATAATGTGWLINYAATGGYADSGVQQSAAAVIAKATSTGYLNLNLTATPAPGTGTSANGFSIDGASYNGSAPIPSVGTTNNNATIVLSGGINMAGVGGVNDIVISPSTGGSQIQTGNTTAIYLSGNSNQINVFWGSDGVTTGNNTTVIGFNNTDHMTIYTMNGARGGVYANEVVLAPTATSPVQGSSLLFPGAAYPNAYIINVGTVADETPASMAAAANKVYVVADTAAENILFIGQSGSDTQMWEWSIPPAIVNGYANYGLTNRNVTADTNGNHLVDASELNLGVTLIGIQASSLTAANFHN